MTIEILLRDGVSRQAASSGMQHKIDGLGLEESVSVLRAKAAPLLQLKAEEISSCSYAFFQDRCYAYGRPCAYVTKFCAYGRPYA